MNELMHFTDFTCFVPYRIYSEGIIENYVDPYGTKHVKAVKYICDYILSHMCVCVCMFDTLVHY